MNKYNILLGKKSEKKPEIKKVSKIEYLLGSKNKNLGIRDDVVETLYITIDSNKDVRIAWYKQNNNLHSKDDHRLFARLEVFQDSFSTLPLLFNILCSLEDTLPTPQDVINKIEEINKL